MGPCTLPLHGWGTPAVRPTYKASIHPDRAGGGIAAAAIERYVASEALLLAPCRNSTSASPGAVPNVGSSPGSREVMRLLDLTTPESPGGRSHRPDRPWSPDEGHALEGVANPWDARLTAMVSERVDRPRNGGESHGLWTWYCNCNQVLHICNQPAAGAPVEIRDQLDHAED